MKYCLNLQDIDRVFNSNGLLLIEIYEKHGTITTIASTSQGFFKFFLDLLEKRKEQGYFEIEEPNNPLISEDLIKNLPEGMTKKTAIQERHNYLESLDDFNNDKIEYLNIEKALKDKNGRLAYSILKKRSEKRYEYEEINVDETGIV